MIQSMTGFGKASREIGNINIQVEIKSLNSKGIDLSLRTPSVYREKEMELRSEISKILERGKIDVSINLENKTEDTPVKINTSLAKNYYDQLKTLAVSLGENEKSLLSEVLRMPDVMKNEKKELDEEEWKLVKEVLHAAIVNMQTFRKEEGQSIENDFTKQINVILERLVQIEEADPKRIENVKTRISKNLNEYIPVESIDKNRFEQELIYYIEKIDINEEKVRLKTHCNYFLTTMKEPGCGRKLNFIAQEIGREINTIGSKANDVDIQKLVVLMKDELEKIKEQTNNVL
ncbi:MAG: YicC/YloC family endoribonuclease [Bacteroidota bacterium]|nr:YicC/YloC family endoribonuclease [Bacteroidota bacterium]